eukprot:15339746-Ditylum_brightwellii.AAC.1
MSINKNKQAECGTIIQKGVVGHSGIDQAIIDFRNKNVDIEGKCNIEDYLGMRIEKLSDGRIRITQPQIIQSNIDDEYMSPSLKTKGALDSATRLLTRDLDAPKFGGKFHCRQMIGKLH